MARNILAVFAGLVVGMIVNMGVIFLNAYVLYPMPPGTSMQEPESFNAYLATLPATAFLVVIAAHLGQAFFGGWTAACLGASSPVRLALTVGVITMIGGIFNLMNLEAPKWMAVEVPLYLLVAYVAGKIEENRRSGKAEAAPS